MSKKIRAAILSTLAAMATALVLLMMLSLLLSKLDTLPKSALPVLTTVVACAAVFLGGLLSSLLLKERGLINGVIVAVIFSVILFGVSIFVFETELGLSALTKFAAILMSGILGGILGVNRKSRVKF